MDLTKIDQAALDAIMRKHAMFRAARMGGARAVLAYHDLSRLSLGGQDYSHADFTGAVLYQADMREAKLDYAVLFGADLRLTNMVNSSMVRADMRGSNLRGATLVNSDMTGVDLREGSIAKRDGSIIVYGDVATDGVGADLSGANMTLARMSGIVANNCNFSDATMKGCKIVRASLQGASFEGTNLESADFSLCDLSDTNMRGAILINITTNSTNFANADLTGALTDTPIGPSLKDLPFSPTEMLERHRIWLDSEGREGGRFDISNYDIRRNDIFCHARLAMMRGNKAVLYGMDFSDAKMQAAEMRDADLRNANLMSSDLRGSDLRRTKLNGASLQGAQLQPLLLGGGRELITNFSCCYLRYANLSGANLKRVNLRGADLSGTNFVGADMTGADLTNSSITNARISPEQKASFIS